MHFVVRKGSELFDKLSDIKKEMASAHKAAVKLLNQILPKQWEEYAADRHNLCGGITAVKTKKGINPDPAKWKRVGADHEGCFMPKVAAKDLCKMFSELPKVDKKTLNDLLAYKGGMVPGTLIWSYTPGVSFGKEEVLIHMHDGWAGKYHPVDGMEELTATKAAELEDKIKKEANGRREK